MHAMEMLALFSPKPVPAWTAGAPLPGGDIADGDFAGFLAELGAARPWLPAPLAERYARPYGTPAKRLLRDACSLADPGPPYGGHIRRPEPPGLVDQPWER